MSRHRRTLHGLVLGAVALAFAAPALAAGVTSSAGVCRLLTANEVPAGVKRVCYAQPVNRTIPAEPNYSAIVGSTVTHDIKLTVFKPSDAESLSLFKQMPSLVASATSSKSMVVAIGSWAREVRYVGAGNSHYSQVIFLAGGYACQVLYANPTSNANVLSVARAMAGRV
jgi:hypothetical protein